MITVFLILLYLIAVVRQPFLLAALLFHAAIILHSAWTYGRIPLVGLHDTLSFLAFSIGAASLFVKWERKRELYSYSVPLIIVLIGASLFSPAMSGPLPPVLRTVWFELHVLLSFIAYALFGIGAIFGILRLTRKAEAAESCQYRILLLGYVLFSVAMIFGGIWAFYAWGTYWLWTPKELWTTIVWFWYSLYLHARLVRGWSGPRVAWIGIIGFVIVLFTYAGVGLLMKSSHEF